VISLGLQISPWMLSQLLGVPCCVSVVNLSSSSNYGSESSVEVFDLSMICSRRIAPPSEGGHIRSAFIAGKLTAPVLLYNLRWSPLFLAEPSFHCIQELFKSWR